MTALIGQGDARLKLSDLPVDVPRSDWGAVPEWVALATVRPAITFKVYGVRVDYTETAVHLAFGPIRRDPNRPAACPCRFCQLEDAAHRLWSKC